MTGAVLDLRISDDHHTRMLAAQVIQLQHQLAAVMDAYVNESVLAWSVRRPIAPTDDELAAKTTKARQHLMRVALLATPKAGQR